MIWDRKMERIPFTKLSVMNLELTVKETIQKYRMFSHGDGVLVAVSGGPDSIALLHVLSTMREESGLHLAVAHLMHGIRGEAAREDARFVAQAAQSLAVPFHLKEVDLPRMKAEKGKGNIEAMAREERYRFFASLAKELRIGAVATAHTRDDQVETLLMWLLRGSGRKGLGGLPPVRRLVSKGEASQELLLIRPLIEASREEIIEYLTERGLPYRTDRTNFDPSPLRNWIRLRLLPQLRERAGVRLDERLAGLADLLRDEEKVLRRVATKRFKRILDGAALSREALLQEDKAMQRRLVRLWLERARGDLKAIGFDHVEKMLRLIAEGPPQGRLSLPGRWELVRDYETVRLERRGAGSKPACYGYTLPLEGQLMIPEAGMKIFSSRISFSADAWPQRDVEEIFDLAFLPDTLTVRNFRAGDRFQPLGMQGHKKLKDLFIEKKVPLKVRATLPLLLAGNEILWVPGYGRSEVGRVRDETKEVLKVRFEVCND